MKPSVWITSAFALLICQPVLAQSAKRDIQGISLGMPLPEVTQPDKIASAGEWKSTEQMVQVGDHRCRKLNPPWKGSVGQLACRIDQQSQLFLDVALRTEPPAIQSITALFCSAEEPSRVLERVHQEYRIANGRSELNSVLWGPVYRLDGRTMLTLGYGGHACSTGRGFELRLQDFQLGAQNLKGVQDRARQTPTKGKS